MVNGKMSSWQTGAEGQKLNLENSIAKIKEQYLINNSNEAELIVDKVTSELSDDTDAYQIQEIIGTGHSKFSGSPGQ